MRLSLLAAAGLLLAQPTDPIPDSLRLAIVRAHRDQIAAETAKRDAMISFHAAEAKFEKSKRDLESALHQANQACGPTAAFDLDRLACVPIPGRQ